MVEGIGDVEWEVDLDFVDFVEVVGVEVAGCGVSTEGIGPGWVQVLGGLDAHQETEVESEVLAEVVVWEGGDDQVDIVGPGGFSVASGVPAVHAPLGNDVAVSGAPVAGNGFVGGLEGVDGPLAPEPAPLL